MYIVMMIVIYDAQVLQNPTYTAGRAYNIPLQRRFPSRLVTITSYERLKGGIVVGTARNRTPSRKADIGTIATRKERV